ncbi:MULTISPECIES: universal stress protein [Petrimonas]|jgi:nucleotide-binding universal stress UspA family protein|uniref:universal stress protein n=1 Tax=Petrimonas TaxID=307628 RepID=UPI0008E80ECC|nr:MULTISPECIES: universal stress protein [Petrimonas]MDD3560559.1 universal stress protein [Petrimonas mucosa]SFU47312.1 Nucleotide-binding universal stress protein, UspA family [Porphyromonadaceae bacterium KHP3R9]HHT30025.1 universal stress protein [Petrimonas mucosa]
MGKEDKKPGGPEQKLVTVAIHSYEKAVILKSILESEGIPAVIHGVSIIQPTVPGNVRVRINESDLPKALTIIEQVDFTSNVESMDDLEHVKVNNEVLIPVDFSSYTMKACEFGFNLAFDIGCEVKLIHAFFTPYYPMAIPFGDSFSVQTSDRDLYKDIRNRMESEMERLVKNIRERIANKELPDVRFTSALMEGLPEEEIISYSKKQRPRAIVMGTRGSNAKDLDLIGSVTAEVIDGCRTPIFAIPENSKDQDISQMKNILFLTNFREREFKAFDIMMGFIRPYPVKVYLAHMSRKGDMWDEIKLSGTQRYLEEQYPDLDIDYKLIDRDRQLEIILEEFVEEHKIDMIAMSSSRRGLFTRIFNPGIARRMLFHSDTPLLVIKGL